MPTFALLGATGRVGGLVFETVLEKTDSRVNCYVRSSQKLKNQSSRLMERSDFDDRVIIHEGDMSSVDALQHCIRNTDVVFLCAAASRNTPGCRIARDQADAVIAALRNIKSQDSGACLPKLVVLSSSSTEPTLSAAIPSPLRAAVYNANSNIYDDLIAAERQLRSHDELVTAIFVKPGGLSSDAAHGHALVTDRSQTFLSRADLVGGMVEVAQVAADGDRWDGKVLSVVSPAGKARVEWPAIPHLLGGLMVHYFPWLYGWVH